MGDSFHSLVIVEHCLAKLLVICPNHHLLLCQMVSTMLTWYVTPLEAIYKAMNRPITGQKIEMGAFRTRIGRIWWIF